MIKVHDITFVRFGAEGRIRIREEDVDGDGAIDVRSHYRDGRLVSRELSGEAAT